MVENIEKQILEFIKNRNKIGESTGSRHVHIRFDIEIMQAEKILESLSQKKEISVFYDEDYQEKRYLSK